MYPQSKETWLFIFFQWRISSTDSVSWISLGSQSGVSVAGVPESLSVIGVTWSLMRFKASSPLSILKKAFFKYWNVFVMAAEGVHGS